MLDNFGPLFGRVTGIAGVLAGLFCYLQNPLLRLTLEQFNGDWHPVEYAQICLATLACIALVLSRWCSAEAREEAEAEAGSVSSEAQGAAAATAITTAAISEEGGAATRPLGVAEIEGALSSTT